MIPDVVADLRATFDSGRTKPFTWREAQLEGLDRLLAENGAELEAALAADLGKSATEAYLTEIGFLRTELAHVRARFRRWLAPQRVPVPLSLRPARASIIREPLGVVLVIAPWNYPVQLTFGPLIGALAAGNTALLKPSELTPTVSATIARLVPRYLDGVAVVEGGPEETGEVLAQRFDHIVYTGGSRVARIVMRAAAEHLTPVTLELGGKSPAWVDGTTDLRTAARRLAWGKFLNAGQTCVAPDYVLAPPDVARRLEPLLAEAVADMYGPDPRNSPDYGRIISAHHHARVVELLEGSVAAGARVVTGGEHDGEAYLAPTVLADVGLDSPAMAEEIFGPVLPLVAVDGIAEAVAVIRAGEKPLALYAFTEDARTRRTLLRETSSGAVVFGAPAVHLAVPSLPFGGVGGSGMGSYHGEHSVRTLSHPKPVLRKPSSPDTLALIRPPFTGLKERLARRLM
ncbi:aldehyde dehydrogenase family protein [Georgenia faecalis]|uniref:Aldehyde dehydrogenase n=1 Tax=Georgenia faecalis TaxID=2483799 RepID=A0ABV9D6R7_9MICO|nr:aldehyde dehydrogenase family protein [Georgenia faecalis]